MNLDFAAPATPECLGVLGGMGPLATADFLRKIIELTPAKADADHVPTLVRSVPQIPDRSASILGTGPSPVPALVKGVRQLIAAGATRIAIPCNTAHYWYDELSKFSTVPIFHIAECVAHRLIPEPAHDKVGLLATEGTIRARIYQDRLEDNGIGCLVPTQSELSDLVMPGIRMVKAGLVDAATSLLSRAANLMFERGAQRIIMGCTEIPVALSNRVHVGDAKLIDPTNLLAEACVAWWSEVKPHDDWDGALPCASAVPGDLAGLSNDRLAGR